MFRMPMVAGTYMDATRFQGYVEELRQFSRSDGVPCGSPSDLPALVEELKEVGSFRGECTSMLRSVVYREHGQVPPGELLRLVVSAWGGSEEPETDAAWGKSRQFLMEYVGGVMREPKRDADIEVESEGEPRMSVADVIMSDIPASSTTSEFREHREVMDRRPIMALAMAGAASEKSHASAMKQGRPASSSISASPIAPVSHHPVAPVGQNKSEASMPLADIDAMIRQMETESADVRFYMRLASLKMERMRALSVERASEQGHVDGRPRPAGRPRSWAHGEIVGAPVGEDVGEMAAVEKVK